MATTMIGEAIRGATTQDGTSLDELSRERPVLVVFLRHFGCTFCREALADLRELRPTLEAEGTGVVFVHQSSEEEAAAVMARYGLGDAPRISDPDRELYRAFDLGRGQLSEVATPKVWARGTAAVLRGHWPGKVSGDARQMPGVFLVADGEVRAAFRHETAADRPDYAGIAACDSSVCQVGP